MRLENKVAIISGGARGMGAQEARLFASEGARVVIGDVLDDVGRQTEAEINETGAECLFVHLDVTSEDDWRNAVSAAVSRFGRVDILVNNAGISTRGGIEDMTAEQWELTMDINVKGVFLGTREVIPAMRDAGGGSIINISSGAGIAPAPGTSGAYAASKGAVRLFTSPPPSSTPARVSGATRYTPARCRPPCWATRRTTRNGSPRRWGGSRWGAWASPSRSLTACSTWPATSLRSSPAPRW